MRLLAVFLVAVAIVGGFIGQAIADALNALLIAMVLGR